MKLRDISSLTSILDPPLSLEINPFMKFNFPTLLLIHPSPILDILHQLLLPTSPFFFTTLLTIPKLLYNPIHHLIYILPYPLRTPIIILLLLNLFLFKTPTIILLHLSTLIFKLPLEIH